MRLNAIKFYSLFFISNKGIVGLIFNDVLFHTRFTIVHKTLFFNNKDEHVVGNHCQGETLMKIYQFLEKNTRKPPLQRVCDLVTL